MSSLNCELRKQPGGVTVVSIVGVNGTGKTTTSAKLANLIQSRGQSVVLGACDTFRAAAIEQLKLWGERLNVPVVAGAYNADPAAVAHDAVAAAQARNADYLLVEFCRPSAHEAEPDGGVAEGASRDGQETAWCATRDIAGARRDDGYERAQSSAGISQVGDALTGLVITKLDGTSKGGMVVAIQRELGFTPIKLIGLGEKAAMLGVRSKTVAEALFSDEG